MTKSNWQKERRHKWKAMGLCQVCGKVQTDGMYRCATCTAKQSVRQKKYEAEHPKVYKPEWVWNDSLKAKQRQRRAERIEKGLCYVCGKDTPAAPSRKCQGCLDKVKASYIRYNAKNPEKRKTWRAEQKQVVLDHYGNKCACCGETQKEFLTVDHVNNDGYLHRKEVSGSQILRWLIKNNFPEGFQILCFNCNCARAFHGNGICPHQLNKVAEEYNQLTWGYEESALLQALVGNSEPAELVEVA